MKKYSCEKYQQVTGHCPKCFDEDFDAIIDKLPESEYSKFYKKHRKWVNPETMIALILMESVSREDRSFGSGTYGNPIEVTAPEAWSGGGSPGTLYPPFGNPRPAAP